VFLASLAGSRTCGYNQPDRAPRQLSTEWAYLPPCCGAAIAAISAAISVAISAAIIAAISAAIVAAFAAVAAVAGSVVNE
jgi:hypothetical protein